MRYYFVLRRGIKKDIYLADETTKPKNEFLYILKR